MMLPATPLYIPLMGVWYDAFASGNKTEEWRRYGGRWTERACYPGRRVSLVRGYSGARLTARIVAVETRYPDTAERIEFFGRTTNCLVMSLADIWPYDPTTSVVSAHTNSLSGKCSRHFIQKVPS